MHGVGAGDYIIIGILFILATLLAGAIVGAGVGAIVDFLAESFAYWTIRGCFIGVGVTIIAAGVHLLTKLS